MLELHREAEGRANRVRAELELSSRPVPDIVNVLEKLGLIVFVHPWGEGPLGAYLPRGERKYVFLNGGGFLPRVRFTGAHEIGHHVFRDGPRLDTAKELGGTAVVDEKRANSFAASFLLPRDGIAVSLGAGHHKITAEDVLQLATLFGVSYEMTTYRIHNINLINAAKRDELLANRMAVLTPEYRQRAAELRHLPADYVNGAFTAYLNDRVSFDRLAQLLQAERMDEKLELARDLRARELLHEDDAAEFGLD